MLADGNSNNAHSLNRTSLLVNSYLYCNTTVGIKIFITWNVMFVGVASCWDKAEDFL